MIAKDRYGNEVRVGGRVFVQRHAPSLPVVAIEWSKTRPDIFYVKVDHGEGDGPEWFFDIAVKVDVEYSAGVG